MTDNGKGQPRKREPRPLPFLNYDCQKCGTHMQRGYISIPGFPPGVFVEVVTCSECMGEIPVTGSGPAAKLIVPPGHRPPPPAVRG